MFGSVREAIGWCLDLWGRFSPRERAFVGFGFIGIVVLLGYQFVVSPYIDRLKVIDRLIAQKEKEIVELSLLREDYLAARDKIRDVESRAVRESDDFSLFSHVEEIAARQHIKDRIIFIRPQPAQTFSNYREVAVEVKFENMALAQVVGLLDAFQNSTHFVRVKRVDLKTRYNDPKLLDGTFLVASYEKTA